MCGFLICVKFTCRCCGSGSCAWPVQGLSDRASARCLFVPNGVRLAVLDCALFFCVRLFSSGIRWSGLFAEPATRSFVWQKKFLRHKPAGFSYFFLHPLSLSHCRMVHTCGSGMAVVFLQGVAKAFQAMEEDDPLVDLEERARALHTKYSF